MLVEAGDSFCLKHTADGKRLYQRANNHDPRTYKNGPPSTERVVYVWHQRKGEDSPEVVSCRDDAEKCTLRMVEV
jgi:hypothetical protein